MLSLHCVYKCEGGSALPHTLQHDVWCQSYIAVADTGQVNEMFDVLGHHSALFRLYWSGDNLGE